MEMICISKRIPGADSIRLSELATAEARAAWELYADGTVRGLYFDAERPVGIIRLEAEDKEAARRSLQRLPMVAEGLIDFDIFALGPYRQLASLFAH